MICTVTLNASIDKAYRISGGLEVGTVMRVLDCTDTAGGKGLNAARAVATCGERVVATGFVGGNNGRLLCELLQRDGIPEDFVRVTAETRCCVNVLDGNETSTEFLEPGREVSATEFARMRERLLSLAAEASVVTIDGSVPHGVSPDDYAGLVEGVRNMGTPCILDTSGVLLERGVKAHPTMVKPNTDEIGQILGRKVTSMSEVAEAAAELHEGGVEQVVVSLGGDGAIMACDEGVFRGIAPKIEVVNPVGSGDTMVGAFAVAMERGMTKPEQLRFAMGCASANCLSKYTGHFNMEDAKRLAEGTRVERID
jgi:tagatose 6-phosphate kinase